MSEKPKQQQPSEHRQVASTRSDSVAVGMTPGAPKLRPTKETKQGADPPARLGKLAPADKTPTPVKVPSSRVKEEERVVAKADKKPPSGRILARDREVTAGKVTRAKWAELKEWGARCPIIVIL